MASAGSAAVKLLDFPLYSVSWGRVCRAGQLSCVSSDCGPNCSLAYQAPEWGVALCLDAVTQDRLSSAMLNVLVSFCLQSWPLGQRPVGAGGPGRLDRGGECFSDLLHSLTTLPPIPLARD